MERGGQENKGVIVSESPFFFLKNPPHETRRIFNLQGAVFQAEPEVARFGYVRNVFIDAQATDHAIHFSPPRQHFGSSSAGAFSAIRGHAR